MKFLSVILGLFFLAGSAFAATPQVSPDPNVASTRYQISFEIGDSGETPAILNNCASWNASFVDGTDGKAQIWAVPDKSTAAASGEQLGEFLATSSFPVNISTGWPHFRVLITEAPSVGTATIYMYCIKGASGGGGGGLPGLTAAISPFGEAGTLKAWPTLSTAWTLSMIQEYDDSAIGRPPGSLQPAAQVTRAGATCATGNVGTMYVVTDSNGDCTTAGPPTRVVACECTSTDAGVLLFPVTQAHAETTSKFGGGAGGYGGDLRWQGRDDLSIWAVQTTGTAGTAPHRRGIPVPLNVDWTGSWDMLWLDRAYEPDSCIQMKRIGGPSFVPIQGHTMAAYLHFTMSQQGAVDTNIEATTAFVGWTESDATGFIINGTGATPADVIQNINNGFGVLWHNNQFHEVWVRNGSENFSVLYDLSDAAERLLYWQSSRQIHTMQVASLLSPANGEATTRKAGYAAGFYPMSSAAWKTSFEPSPTSGQFSPGGNVAFTAVRAVCEDVSKPNPGFIELMIAQQKILQVGTGF